MARAGEHRGKLVGCPMCGTKVSDVAMGLRDFAWVNEALPGRLGLMDIDGCLTQARTGRVLMLELKPKGEYISRGAKLTYALFVKAGYDVWYVWDEGEEWVSFSPAGDDGAPTSIRRIRRETMAHKVRTWWEAGLGA